MSPAPFAGAESLLLNDEHDALLAARVHPEGWSNPAPKARYHLVVLGGGTAGLVAAAGAAGLGAKVALVERALLGGDCLNTGCVPSKGVIRAAKAVHAARHGERFGLRLAGEVGFDFAAAMERMRSLRAHIARHDSAERFAGLGVDVFLGDGRFVGPEALEVGGATLRFKRAVLATGAGPLVPPLPGLVGNDKVLTSDTLFRLTELPRRLVVVGAGPIGSEMAQAFARMGSEVTVLDLAQRGLGHDDPEAAALLQRSLEADGVDFKFGVRLHHVDPDGTVHGTQGDDGVRCPADAVLVAIGRRPRLEGLGLGQAGVQLRDGRLVTDDFLRTTSRRIYAAGDVVGAHQFTHAADAHARIVIGNALFPGRGRRSRLTIPWATYTDPEVAHVGPRTADLDPEATEAFTIDFDEVDRTQLEGERGFVRAHVRRGTGKLVAATVVGPEAGDLIGVFSLMLSEGLGLGSLSRSVMPYPSRVLALKQLGDAWNRTRLTEGRKRVLQRWFDWTV